jgi:hypothetical protein
MHPGDEDINDRLRDFGAALTEAQRGELRSIHETALCAAHDEGQWCCVDRIAGTDGGRPG